MQAVFKPFQVQLFLETNQLYIAILSIFNTFLKYIIVKYFYILKSIDTSKKIGCYYFKNQKIIFSINKYTRQEQELIRIHNERHKAVEFAKNKQCASKHNINGHWSAYLRGWLLQPKRNNCLLMSQESSYSPLLKTEIAVKIKPLICH